MTAAVLPYQPSISMSMSLFGNSDRGDGYYQPDSLTNSTEQYEAPQSHAHFRVPNSSARDGGTFLHPKNSLPPLQPTSNYSSPTVMIPPVSHQKHQYGPISNSSLQTTPSSLSYVEHGSGSGYTNAQYSGTPYSLTGTPDQVASHHMMRAPAYNQASPTSTLPSPHSAVGRPLSYGYTSYYQALQPQPNYVHSAGAMPYNNGRASFSSVSQPASATSAYTRYNEPTTPQSAREQSSMYAQGYTTSAQVTTPRQAPIPAYHSMSSSASKAASPPSGTSHSTGAAPGPIPASTPQMRTDENGIQWLKFMYSKDKHKREYEIRCDAEAVDTKQLSPTFKAANLVYPRAQKFSEYTGNRWAYESECNHIGWALTHLNPELRENRGATQRAVDSWRNTSGNTKMRSRRVKRQTKAQTRAKAQQQMQASQQSVLGGRNTNALAMQRPLPETSSSTHEHHLPASKLDLVTTPMSTSISTPLHTLPPPNQLTNPVDSRYTAQGYHHPQRHEYETGTYYSMGYGQHTQGNTTYNMMPPPPQAGASLYTKEDSEYAGRHQ